MRQLKAKDDKAKASKEAAAKATAEALKATANAPKTAASPQTPATPPVLLPGKSTVIPIELAWGSTTSLYQPKIGVFS